GVPELPDVKDGKSGLEIVVIFTSVNATTVALNRAAKLAESLDARITLVVPQVVPFPLPLTSPPVHPEFQERRFRDIVAGSPVDIRVQLYFCRDEVETLKRVLTPHSLVVIGGRKRWWATREQRLAQKLQSGHEVIFAQAE